MASLPRAARRPTLRSSGQCACEPRFFLPIASYSILYAHCCLDIDLPAARCSSQGKELAALDSSGLTNHGISLSANGQFVAAATFTSDVKIHEIVLDRGGAFKTTQKVMDLKVRKLLRALGCDMLENNFNCQVLRKQTTGTDPFQPLTCGCAQGHTRQVSAVAFSPDGRRAVTASQDHSLRIWKLDVRYAQQEDPKCIVKADQQVTSVPSPSQS